MPFFVYACEDHKEHNIKLLISNPKEEPKDLPKCPICDKFFIRQLSNIGLTKVNVMTNRDRAVKIEDGWMDKADKRTQQHFVDHGIHDMLDSKRGTLDRDTALKKNTFVKEGGKWRVRKKVDIK